MAVEQLDNQSSLGWFQEKITSQEADKVIFPQTKEGLAILSTKAKEEVVSTETMKQIEQGDIYQLTIKLPEEDIGRKITIAGQEFTIDKNWNDKNWKLDFKMKKETIKNLSGPDQVQAIYTLAILQAQSRKLMDNSNITKINGDITKIMGNICKNLWLTLPNSTDPLLYKVGDNVISMAVWNKDETLWIFDLSFWQRIFNYSHEQQKNKNERSIIWNFKLDVSGMDWSSARFETEPSLTIKVGDNEFKYTIKRDGTGKTILTPSTSVTIKWFQIDSNFNVTNTTGEIATVIMDAGKYTDENNEKFSGWYEELICNIYALDRILPVPGVTLNFMNWVDFFDEGKLTSNDSNHSTAYDELSEWFKKIDPTWCATYGLAIASWVNWNEKLGDVEGLSTLIGYFDDKTIKTMSWEDIDGPSFVTALKKKADSEWQDSWNRQLLLWRALVFVKLAHEANPAVVFAPELFTFTQWKTKYWANAESEKFVKVNTFQIN